MIPYPFHWVEDTLKSHLVNNYAEISHAMAWKNLTFDASGFKVWLKIINTPSSEDPVTLGPYGDNEMRGFLQIGIYSQLNIGIEESNAVLGHVSKIFSVPRQLQAPDGCMLRLTRKTFSQGGQTSIADFTRGGVEGVWDAQYVTIYWLAREPKQRI